MTRAADEASVLAIDPGREKHGIAVVRADLVCVARAVVSHSDLVPIVTRLRETHHPARLVVGGGTGHKEVLRRLSEAGLVAEVVPERDTTRRARARYFAENPPAGLRRWLPLGLLVPPVPIDDYAALLIAENTLLHACPPKI
jgi:hypothetical protein